LAWSLDGRHLVSTSFHGSKVWDPETGRLRFALPLQRPGSTRLALGPNGHLISLHFSVPNAADRKGRLVAKTLDFATREEFRKFTTPVFMYGHALSGDCRRLAVAGEQAITLIDLGDGATLASIPHRFPVAVFSAALNADGRLLAWSEPRAVHVWDTATATPAGPTLQLRGDHLAFSPDGASLAVCRNERDQFRGGAEIWDYRAGRELITLRGHTNSVLRAAFSPDGRRLATASADTTVKVWDVATGHELFTFRGHRAVVSGVEFSPDGTRLASSSQDGTVRIWDARPGDD
jgi:WD40 repeat protein